MRRGSININRLPEDRREKVRQIRGRLRRGSCCTANKITDEKGIEKVLDDIKKKGGK